VTGFQYLWKRQGKVSGEKENIRDDKRKKTQNQDRRGDALGEGRKSTKTGQKKPTKRKKKKKKKCWGQTSKPVSRKTQS